MPIYLQIFETINRRPSYYNLAVWSVNRAYFLKYFNLILTVGGFINFIISNVKINPVAFNIPSDDK